MTVSAHDTLKVGGQIVRWAADRAARRVPTFVIETTHLDTKKAIVANYGFGAVFKNVGGKAVLAKKGTTVKGEPAVARSRTNGRTLKARKATAKGPLVRKLRASRITEE